MSFDATLPFFGKKYGENKWVDLTCDIILKRKHPMQVCAAFSESDKSVDLEWTTMWSDFHSIANSKDLTLAQIESRCALYLSTSLKDYKYI